VGRASGPNDSQAECFLSSPLLLFRMFLVGEADLAAEIGVATFLDLPRGVVFAAKSRVPMSPENSRQQKWRFEHSNVTESFGLGQN
jgi:hypothetical protein